MVHNVKSLSISQIVGRNVVFVLHVDIFLLLVTFDLIPSIFVPIHFCDRRYRNRKNDSMKSWYRYRTKSIEYGVPVYTCILNRVRRTVRP